MKVALCAIARNENLYIREWVEYYKNLGIDKIFLYDNNPIDGERFEDVINDYIQSGYIEVINVRGEQKGLLFNEVGINLQPGCYIDCYNNRLSDFDWVCYFDIDEFLTFKHQISLKEFLSQNIFDNIGTILIPWVIYGDNNLLSYDNKPVLERFTRLSNKQVYAIKSIVRTKYTIYDPLKPNLIHVFELNELTKALPNGVACNYIFEWGEISKECINDFPCVLNHYKTKSLEEFVKRSYNRYYGSDIKSNFSNYQLYDYDLIFKEYFKYNEVTPEKIKYIKEHYDYIFK